MSLVATQAAKLALSGAPRPSLQYRRRLGECKDELVGGACTHVDAGIDAIGKLGLK